MSPAPFSPAMMTQHVSTYATPGTPATPATRVRRSSHERRLAKREADPVGYLGRLRTQAAEHYARADAVLADPALYAWRLRAKGASLSERADDFERGHGATPATAGARR